ncbi:hypothetical protein TRFO_23677 [Tritrichomonas foetus]|uniref:Uncharacterized protein n=1 Tax=Tritrichomonas foetus TaxID=1144522 RepID=A0A1J4K903_9EUKA|nr:hypothetical protein TRFO_23677 [Tritrichomonas foetus]|eukprot:OHT07977.1 hypothetical protein TRFO_23677 [Tritrichomonas foetus]
MFFILVFQGLTSSTSPESTWFNYQVITSPKSGTEFGKSVSISATNERIVVGADNEEDGRIYIYEYSNPLKWQQKAIIQPQNTQNVTISQLGFTVSISSDGTRIISGAPKSKVIKNGEIFEVGCVLVFDLIGSNFWIQREPICPIPEHDIRGFGHTLATSSDCKYFATSSHSNDFNIEENNTGTVFVSFEEEKEKWSTPTSLISSEDYHKSDYGTDLHFIDASTILVAVDDLRIGTLIFKRNKENKWFQKDMILPIPSENWTGGITNYGKHIAMPSTDNSIIAVTATKESQKAGSVFILKKISNTNKHHTFNENNNQIKYSKNDFNKLTNQEEIGERYLNLNKNEISLLNRLKSDQINQWELISHLEFPEKASLEDVFFCGLDFLASPSGLNNNGLGAVHLFSRNDQKFNFTETISPKEAKMFGSSFTWNSRCNRFVVGAMGDQFSNGQIYIYTRMKGFWRNRQQVQQQTKNMSIMIASSVIALSSVFNVCISVIFLYLRHKKLTTLKPITIV